MADVDHWRRDGLVALDGGEIVAIASYAEVPEPSGSGMREAEIAVTVEDAWQHRGVGLRLARDLAVLAEARGYDAFVASVLAENRAALGLLRKLRPAASVAFAGGEYEARLPLAS